MNRWRILIVLLVLIALVLLILAAWLGWDVRSVSRLARGGGFIQPLFSHRLATIHQVNPFFSTIGAFITLYLAGILVLLILPVQIHRMGQALSNSALRLLRIFLVGLLAAVLVGAIGIGSALAISTFPLTIILGGLLFVSGFVGFVAIAFTLGRALLRRAEWQQTSPLISLLLGLLLLYSLGEILLVGVLLNVVFISLGIGVVITTRFGSGVAWSLSPLKED